MPRDIEGVQYFTQEEVNTFTGTARTEGRDSGLKAFLKTLGFDKADDATQFVTDARTRATNQQTDAEKLQQEVTTLRTQNEITTKAMRKLALESKAIEAGEAAGLTVPKAKQILRLIDIPDDFNLETGTLNDTFKAFLEKPENAHFKPSAEPPVPSGRKPGDQKPSGDEGKKDKFELLLDRFKSI